MRPAHSAQVRKTNPIFLYSLFLGHIRMETWNMMYKTGLCFLFIILLAVGVSAIPPLPYEFYGNVSINETPAEVGTIIIAKVNGTEVGNITTTAPGAYGGAGTFDRRLVVNGAEDQIGEYITFWIGENRLPRRSNSMQVSLKT